MPDKKDSKTKSKQKSYMKKICIIIALTAIVVLAGLCLQILLNPEPTPEPEPTTTPTPEPEPTTTPTPELAQPEPEPTQTPNMTATQTPTRRVTTGWHHGSGGSSRRSSTPPAPIPEHATCVLMGIGLLYVVMRQRGKVI